MNEIIIREVDIDPRIGGFVKEDPNGDYNVYISVYLSDAKKVATVKHELEHIKGNHLHSDLPVWLLEHKAKSPLLSQEG